ncbi:uncharacterized protein A1O9_11934 [Exophiala aquamarina CBS 119918]|uniref:Uncharacterized protein n=1 Tax=Exophiala aquamarina CBS 119918 TaxID=1182545 RepID=A0A072NVQ0_9EURO|nr:uncharacterized protein A1O9_11934 [Exophiala aquamarina CBS 119918]KEF51944.1 hypothetical protein A1O9_11934 [Exophiala aquamarina CBS 119918]
MATLIDGSFNPRKRPRLSHADYTVACVCPLAVELAPLRAMLDTIHEDLPAQRNHNAYVLGEVGKHNVVLVVLSGIGNNHSGIAATQVLNDFPSIRFVLLVGIGGGVPSAGFQRMDSVRLGDVVVSQPTDTSGGVIQFDRGKLHDGDFFERTGCLNKPPAFLTATVEKLKAKHWQEGNQIRELIADMLSRNQHMNMAYTFPGSEQDQLFESGYYHTGGEHCQQCDVTRVRHREERVNSLLNVHYGAIGSSNSVIKSAMERDSLRKSYNILCVEMEAAGLMDAFDSCLVIRGICDYADSHKNAQWQPFAAAAAAAYAKEFLLTIPAQQQSDAHMPTMLSEHNRDLSHAFQRDDNTFQQQPDSFSVDGATYKRLLDSLTFQRMNSRLLNISRALSQTCQWIFEDETFKTWIARHKSNDHHGFLWIKSKAGSGKSTIMAEILNTLKRTHSKNVILSYFFNAQAPGYLEKSSIGMYRSLVHQLLRTCQSTHQHFVELFSTKVQGDNVDEWSAVELQGFLTHIIEKVGGQPIDILIDALDEGDDSDVRQMVAFLEDLSTRAVNHSTLLRVCLSSRHYPHISIRQGLYIALEHQDGHREDIELFVQHTLRSDGEGKMDRLREKVCQKASSVFLWVVLVVPMLNQLYDRSQFMEMEKRLDEIPDTLDGLFAQILARNSEDIGISILLLQWVLFARRPLSPIELYSATQLGSASASLAETDVLHGDSLNRYLLNCSRGLTEITKANPPVVQFIHESVRDFLIKKNGLAKRDPTLSENFEGVSNEHLSKACLRYFDQCLPPHQGYERRGVPFWKGRIPSFQKTFPFAKYAVTYMFSHANIAEAMGISHLQLVRRFQNNNTGNLLTWVQYWNIFEQFQIRRYTADVHLLYILSENNLLHLSKLLLKDRVDVNVVGQRYGNALQAACAAGHVEMVKLLLENGADVDVVSGEHKHALFAAIHKKQDSVAKLLGRIGVSPPIKLLVERLRTAVRQSNWPTVEVLLATGTSVNLKDMKIDGEPLLYRAVEEGETSVAELLIQRGADVNSYGGKYGFALQAAAVRGDHQLSRILIENGANVNNGGGYYSNALYAANVQHAYQPSQRLIKNEVDVNASEGGWGNALQAAVARGDYQLSRFLLENGANINACRGYYGTALQAAVAIGEHQLSRFLLENGANINASGGYYGTALHAAVALGDHQLSRFLLENGANIDASGTYYGTALQAAVVQGDHQLSQILIENGANINASGAYCGTALQAAVVQGDYQLSRILIENGANVNSFKEQYLNALQSAIQSRQEKRAMLLIESGATYLNALRSALKSRQDENKLRLIAGGADVDVDVDVDFFATTLDAFEALGFDHINRECNKHQRDYITS